ncbi:mitochondrial thiamine pyrophosphate transporter [Mortierella polycephala]|uniref:Mitochondrial thiamine pyrophosphate transporter n=1 Tax=Mortierella polycephala TaxID=41804 RepID=A0A9P6U2H5_9FUNG|nr:mitochondrial thiamine pyrophosphate transporter [Mortierella polycephala]
MTESGFQSNPSAFVETVATTSHSFAAVTAAPASSHSTPHSSTTVIAHINTNHVPKHVVATTTDTRLDKNNSHNTSTRTRISVGAPNLTKAETVFCGSTAGVVSRFIIAPLDVVKIRLQLQTERKELPKILSRRKGDGTYAEFRTKANEGAPYNNRAMANQPKYRGMLSGMATIAREEGIRGLWKGNMAAEYLYLTYGGIQFLVYQQTKSYLTKAAELSAQRAMATNLSSTPIHVLTTITTSSSAQSFVSGATAGIIATACTYPFDLLRTRFSVQRDVKVYTSVLQAFQHIFRKEGVRGFYKGMTPGLIQVIPYMGFMFGSYDAFKHAAGWLKSRANVSPASNLESKMTLSSTSDPPTKTLGQFLLGIEDMLCGALSGIVSKTAVYPLDMVRKRLQIQGSEQQKSIGNLGNYTASSATISSSRMLSSVEPLPTTVRKCLAQIVRREGYLALYKGLLPGVVKAAPASAVTFMVFSQAGALVERIRPRQE